MRFLRLTFVTMIAAAFAHSSVGAQSPTDSIEVMRRLGGLIKAKSGQARLLLDPSLSCAPRSCYSDPRGSRLNEQEGRALLGVAGKTAEAASATTGWAIACRGGQHCQLDDVDALITLSVPSFRGDSAFVRVSTLSKGHGASVRSSFVRTELFIFLREGATWKLVHVHLQYIT